MKRLLVVLGLFGFAICAQQASAQNGVVTSPDAQRAIDLQLHSIIRSIQQEIGVEHRDGSIIREAELRQRTIWQKVQMTFDKYSSSSISTYAERRDYMKKQFCMGETAKLILYGVAWEYEYIDRTGAKLASFRIDRC